MTIGIEAHLFRRIFAAFQFFPLIFFVGDDGSASLQRFQTIDQLENFKNKSKTVDHFGAWKKLRGTFGHPFDAFNTWNLSFYMHESRDHNYWYTASKLSVITFSFAQSQYVNHISLLKFVANSWQNILLWTRNVITQGISKSVSIMLWVR